MTKSLNTLSIFHVRTEYACLNGFVCPAPPPTPIWFCFSCSSSHCHPVLALSLCARAVKPTSAPSSIRWPSSRLEVLFHQWWAFL